MSEDRRHAARRDVDRSGLSDNEWRTEVDKDLTKLARAAAGQTAAYNKQGTRLTKVEQGISGLTEKVEEIGVIVQEHTPVSVEDGAYLAILRTQYPIPLMAKLSVLVTRIEAQEQKAAEHWDTVKELFKYVIGALISICVLIVGMALQAQHIISVPELLAVAVVLLLAGFVGYGLISGKAASFKKGVQP